MAAAKCAAAGKKYAAATDGMGVEIWCGDSPPACPKVSDPTSSTGCRPCPGNKSQTCGAGWVLSALAIECQHLPLPTETAVEVRCRARAAVGSSGGSHPVPPGLLLLPAVL